MTQPSQLGFTAPNVTHTSTVHGAVVNEMIGLLSQKISVIVMIAHVTSV